MCRVNYCTEYTDRARDVLTNNHCGQLHIPCWVKVNLPFDLLDFRKVLAIHWLLFPLKSICLQIIIVWIATTGVSTVVTVNCVWRCTLGSFHGTLEVKRDREKRNSNKLSSAMQAKQEKEMHRRKSTFGCLVDSFCKDGSSVTEWFFYLSSVAKTTWKSLASSSPAIFRSTSQGRSCWLCHHLQHPFKHFQMKFQSDGEAEQRQISSAQQVIPVTRFIFIKYARVQVRVKK